MRRLKDIKPIDGEPEFKPRELDPVRLSTKTKGGSDL